MRKNKNPKKVFLFILFLVALPHLEEGEMNNVQLATFGAGKDLFFLKGD